eukprot:COSAG05_NODE_3238_length_2215_cov_1.879547_1_plen_363_part_00
MEPAPEPEPEPEPRLQRPAELPADWELAHSRTDGRPYYVNLATGESQFEFPGGEPEDHNLWTLETASGGEKYYFNSATGESVWELPLGGELVVLAEDEAEESDQEPGLDAAPTPAKIPLPLPPPSLQDRGNLALGMSLRAGGGANGLAVLRRARERAKEGQAPPPLPAIANATEQPSGEDARSEALRAELQAIPKISSLKKRAREDGVDDELIEDTDDAGSPREALIELIVQNEIEAREQEGHDSSDYGDDFVGDGGSTEAEDSFFDDDDDDDDDDDELDLDGDQRGEAAGQAEDGKEDELLLSVIVPEGLQSGDILLVEDNNTADSVDEETNLPREYEVTIPDGLVAGDEFQVVVDRSAFS